MAEHVGPKVQARPLELIFVVDVSGSMAADAKMQSLNAAMEEALPTLRQVASAQVDVEVKVRVLRFGSSAQWTTSGAVPIDDFWWAGLVPEQRGLTELGAALASLIPVFDQSQLAPSVVLLTDGMPTDTVAPSFEQALAALDAHPVGQATARTAVAIGPDADRSTLESFVRATAGEVLDASSPEQLAELLRVTSTTLLQSASESIW